MSVSRLRVSTERAPELVAAFRRRARLVDAADGFLVSRSGSPSAPRGEILMVSHWRDREAFKQYMRSEAHRISHRRIAPDLKAAIKLERLEQLCGYEIVAR